MKVRKFIRKMGEKIMVKPGVKIEGLSRIERNERELWKRLAGETTRVVDRTRSIISKEVMSGARKNGLVNPSWPKDDMKKYVILAPKNPIVDPGMMKKGFRKHTRISDRRLTLSRLRVKAEWKDDRRGAQRQYVSVIIGTQRYEYPGVFLMAKKKPLKYPTKESFYGVYRSGQFKDGKETLHGASGISLARLMEESGLMPQIEKKAGQVWDSMMSDRLMRLVGRFQGY